MNVEQIRSRLVALMDDLKKREEHARSESMAYRGHQQQYWWEGVMDANEAVGGDIRQLLAAIDGEGTETS